MTNYENRYPELTEEEADPRYQRLCTKQIRELSELTARHAQERIRLRLSLRAFKRDLGIESEANNDPA